MCAHRAHRCKWCGAHERRRGGERRGARAEAHERRQRAGRRAPPALFVRPEDALQSLRTAIDFSLQAAALTLQVALNSGSLETVFSSRRTRSPRPSAGPCSWALGWHAQGTASDARRPRSSSRRWRSTTTTSATRKASRAASQNSPAKGRRGLAVTSAWPIAPAPRSSLPPT